MRGGGGCAEVTSGGWEGLQGGGWTQHELATAATLNFNSV